MPKYMYCST